MKRGRKKQPFEYKPKPAQTNRTSLAVSNPFLESQKIGKMRRTLVLDWEGNVAHLIGVQSRGTVCKEPERERDQFEVAMITEALIEGDRKQYEILEYCYEEYGLSKTKVLAVLRKYRGALWTATRDKTAWIYEIDRWKVAEEIKGEMNALRKKVWGPKLARLRRAHART